MADAQKNITSFWQRFSGRERALALITLLVLLSFPVYKYPYAVQERKVLLLKTKADAVEKDILDVTAQISDLKARAAEVKAGGDYSKVREMDLVGQKGVVLVLEDLSAEARRLGVDLVAVHPSQEIDKEKYKEISMNLDLKGRYRELAEYFRRLEGLSHVVNIRKIRVESCPDSSSVCSAQLEAVTYMEK